VDIPDLVTETLDTPIFSCLVDSLGDVNVQRRTLLQHMVQRKLADLGAHGRLGQLGDGVLGVLNTIRGFIGVKNPNVENALSHCQSI